MSVCMGTVFCGEIWEDLFIPHPGPRLSCTPACSGLGPAASGRWRCTSRWLCRKPRGDAPMSPRWLCRSVHQPECSLALSCRLEAAEKGRNRIGHNWQKCKIQIHLDVAGSSIKSEWNWWKKKHEGENRTRHLHLNSAMHELTFNNSVLLKVTWYKTNWK